MMTVHHIALMLMFLPGAIVAQEWKSASIDQLKADFRASDAKYEGLTNMRMRTRIDAYLAATDREPHQRSTSILWRKGDQYRTDYMGVSSYQDKRIRVTVDEEHRLILLSAPDDPLAVARGGLRDSLFSHASHIGRATLPDGTHYRLMFGGLLGFEAIEVVFDHKGWMRRIEMLWAYEVDLRYRDPASPRVRPKVVMELGIPERIDPASVDTDPLSVVDLRNDGIVARGRWLGYSVFDTRVP